MNIAYACDNNFVDVMCVSIMSFNDHNCDANIYILDCGIEDANKQKIMKLCSGKNAVFFIDAKKTLDGLDYDLNLDRGSIASYARLFLGSMLPNDVDKVLYLDSDTMIRGTLIDLYNIELESYTIGGIRDSFSALNKKVFGIKKNGLFINAGVLLIDLNMWRKKEIEKQISILLTNQNKIFQGDQGVINTIFHGEVKELPLKYDVMTYLYDFTYEEMMMYRKPDDYFNKEEVTEAKLNPIIVHFSSSFQSYRPWEKELLHPFFDEWFYYYQKNDGEFNGGNKTKHRYNRLGILLIGIVHAYIRPIIFIINREKNL